MSDRPALALAQLAELALFVPRLADAAKARAGERALDAAVNNVDLSDEAQANAAAWGYIAGGFAVLSMTDMSDEDIGEAWAIRVSSLHYAIEAALRG